MNPEFQAWLVSQKHMQPKSARDTTCRLNRCQTIIGRQWRSVATAIQKLEDSKEYGEFSVFIKSQLKRALRLYGEYQFGK